VACGRAAGTAVLAALVLAAGAGCATTEQMNTVPQSSASSTSSASAKLKAAERAAVAELKAWLADPQPGTLNYNTVQTQPATTGDGTVNTMSILSGGFTPDLGEASLTGSVQTLGSGATTHGESSAIETDGLAYTTVPESEQSATPQSGTDEAPSWKSAFVHAAWGEDAVHSGWWTALESVQSVTADGVTSLDGITVDMYSATVDLAAVKGIPKALLDSHPVQKAGTTKVEVDVYTQMGSGALVRVTYKLGLPVQIDAAATAASSAGYQVDMSGFALKGATGSATVSPEPTAPDPATVVAPATVTAQTGDADLAALLPF